MVRFFAAILINFSFLFLCVPCFPTAKYLNVDDSKFEGSAINASKALVDLISNLAGKISIISTSNPINSIDNHDILFSIINCDICKKLINGVIADASRRKFFDDELYNASNYLCIEALRSRYNATAMCPSLARLYGPIMWYSIVNSELSAERICEHLHACPNDRAYRWNQSQLSISRSLKKPSKNKKTSSKPIKLLHITDMHIDIDFEKNAPSTCDYFLCCRNSMTGSNPAGMYGAYGCDFPLETANLLLEHLETLSGIDLVVYGGDNPPHDIWLETEESQMNAHSLVISMMKKHLPNTPIYPVLGNHESFPESEYIQSRYMNLTAALAKLWKSWAPFPEGALETLSLGGYYTLMLKPKLRLISYNSDYGYLYNFYSLLNHKNPAYTKQTQWIQETLETARRNGEKVLIVGHIPPGIGSTTDEYGDWYYNITNHFSDIIVGQLFGHTHQDHFKVLQRNNQVFGPVLITPSVTTFPQQNPSFRVYTIDSETFEMLDYDQYFLNITKANILAREGKLPQFELNYSARELYQLKDLSAESWWDLVQRFKTNSTLFMEYFANVNARSVTTACDADCRKKYICDCESYILAAALACFST